MLDNITLSGYTDTIVDKGTLKLDINYVPIYGESVVINKWVFVVYTKDAHIHKQDVKCNEVGNRV